MDRSGPPLHAWLAEPTNLGRPEVQKLAPLWPAARVLALSAQPVEQRQLALEALVRSQPKLAVPVVGQLLLADLPAMVQSAATRAVRRMGGVELTSRILDSWSEISLGTHREFLDAVLASPASAAALVEALENQKVAVTELDPASREVLRHLADPAARKRALAILARSAPADRSTVVARYQAALRLSGDAARGAGLFAKNCQTCHQHQGQGHCVGPDLSGIAGRPPACFASSRDCPRTSPRPSRWIPSAASGLPCRPSWTPRGDSATTPAT